MLKIKVCFLSTDELFFHTVMGEGKVISLSGTGRQKQARWGKGYKPLQDKKNLSKSLSLEERQYNADSQAEWQTITRSRSVKICVEFGGFERV